MLTQVSKILIVLSLVTSSAIAQHETVIIGNEEVPLESHIVFTGSGALTSPRRLFADSYDKANGLSFGIGLALTPEGMSNVHVGTYAFTFFRDKFEVSDKIGNKFNLDDKATASVSGFQVGSRFGVPLVLSKSFVLTPYLGSDWGGARFSISDKTYNKFGKSTLSELKSENNKIQMSQNFKVGLFVTGISNLSLEYSYNFMDVERAWMVWHSLISEIIGKTLINGIPQIFIAGVSEETHNSLGFGLGVLAYKIATSAIWYNLNYENHNWPFDDDAPLRYRRQMVTVNLYF